MVYVILTRAGDALTTFMDATAAFTATTASINTRFNGHILYEGHYEVSHGFPFVSNRNRNSACAVYVRHVREHTRALCPVLFFAVLSSEGDIYFDISRRSTLF